EALRALDEIVRIACERDELWSTKDEVNISATAGAEVERLRIAHTNAHRRVLLKLPAHFHHHVLLRVVSFESVERMPFFQLGPEFPKRERALLMRRDAHVGTALIDTTEKTTTRRRQHERYTRRVENIFLHRGDDFIHHGEVCAFRSIDAYFKFRFVN